MMSPLAQTTRSALAAGRQQSECWDMYDDTSTPSRARARPRATCAFGAVEVLGGALRRGGPLESGTRGLSAVKACGEAVARPW